MQDLAVAHVYRTYFPDPPGGLQEAIRQIALTTGMQGVDNTVFTLSPQPRPAILQRPEACVVRCRSWAAPASCDLGGIGAFLAFSRLAEKSDVLHYLFPWPFADVLHTVVRPGCPAVMTYISDVVRQQLLGRLYAPLMWKVLRQMRLVVANSPAYARTSPVLSHPEIREKVRVIPLGIEESSYPKSGDEEILQRLGIGKDEPYFLFIGVLRYYKGAHFLVKAAKRIGAKVVFAGAGPEGARLKALAGEVGAENVIFAGMVTNAEKVTLLQCCRALVLPSHLRSEAYGMVLVEAAMFGKPLISCEIGTGTSYVNHHEETGFVVEPASPEALASAMAVLLSEDRLATEMGAAARQRYELLFSGPALGKAYAALFREVDAS
ncbi:glycosyltransferase [Methylobacillus flagellatus]|uniref:Glycosyl transferase, group 1 n=1 Tax=Methylobacillus flagellatus (strain ATCC 51484 / DSM 6875 / VKM B-1610 / KT) TaxID=265072 RepID=Q1H1U4_METFK|nr:glycosyltransferase [Methylobacillus flagellatus]ABE49543.1 glycosyl transferase, group 1 [Methylobacillus flagellatus KT]